MFKSIIETFNPSVEAGPGRLVSRHRYDDGFMPDYPAAVIGHGGEWVKPTDDYSNVPTADYVDDGDGGANSGGASGGDDASSGSGTSGGDRQLSYSVWPRVSHTAVQLRPDDHRPFSDFIVSVLKTVQLTSRATLKKSKGKSYKYAGPAKTTTTTNGGIRRAQ